MHNGQGMLPTVSRETLCSFQLPDTYPERRHMPLPASRRDARYEAAFDTQTLVYDVVRTDDRISLFCPRLLNIWPILRDGLRLNGQGVKLKRKVSLRFERIDLPRGATGALSLELNDESYSLPVSEAVTSRFAGLNTMITMVKDTPPDWIVDWARYHVSAQEAQGLVLLDNGSRPDFMSQTVDLLARVKGLQQVAVVAAPFPYGGNAGGRFVVPAKFLQVAMLNTMRTRFLAKARAILSVDVDEFVMPIPIKSGYETVFDRAQRSKLGCISFIGQWAYPQHNEGPVPQRAHHLTSEAAVCKNPKWCLRPGSISDRFVLAVHRPAGALYPFTGTSDIRYWHFSATTTGWKKARFDAPPQGESDPDLRDALAQHLE